MMRFRMPRICERGKVIMALAAFDFQVKGQNQTGALDARQIMESSIVATQQHWQVRLRYTYIERDESRRRDLAGRGKSEDIKVSRTILVNGVPFEQLVERNGQPLSAEEERKQKEKLDKL